jgi:DNA-directed RNA polymerase subunit RPC12/RpoP
MIVKRCATCGRFRAYEEEDVFCIGCGHDSLEAACACGRAYDYALTEPGDELHCPRCGRRLRGRSTGIE